MTGRLTVHTPMQMVGLGLAVGCSVTDKVSPLLTASAFRERPSRTGFQVALKRDGSGLRRAGFTRFASEAWWS